MDITLQQREKMPPIACWAWKQGTFRHMNRTTKKMYIFSIYIMYYTSRNVQTLNRTGPIFMHALNYVLWKHDLLIVAVGLFQVIKCMASADIHNSTQQ